VTECSDVAVFFRLRVCACHNTSVLYLALSRVGLSVLLWIQCCTKCYGLVNNSVRKVSVTLLVYLQTRYELFCCVCFYQSALCGLCVFVLYALSRVFAEENIRYPVCTCRDPIFNSRDTNRVPKTPQQNPGLSVCYKTLILNKFTKRYICFTTYLK